MKKSFLAISMATCMLSSCFPYKYVVAPKVEGTVVDSQNMVPVEGAVVTVSNGSGDIYSRSRSVNTDRAGKFVVPLQTAWGVYFVNQFMSVISADLRVESAGYRPYQKKGLGLPTSRPVRGGNSIGLQYGIDSVSLKVPLQKNTTP